MANIEMGDGGGGGSTDTAEITLLGELWELDGRLNTIRERVQEHKVDLRTRGAGGHARHLVGIHEFNQYMESCRLQLSDSAQSPR